MIKYPKWLMSSVDAESLSLTVKGAIVGAIPVILFLASLFGTNVPEDMIKNLAGGVGDVIVQIAGAVSAVMVVVGLVRKLLVSFGIIKVS